MYLSHVGYSSKPAPFLSTKELTHRRNRNRKPTPNTRVFYRPNHMFTESDGNWKPNQKVCQETSSCYPRRAKTVPGGEGFPHVPHFNNRRHLSTGSWPQTKTKTRRTTHCPRPLHILGRWYNLLRKRREPLMFCKLWRMSGGGRQTAFQRPRKFCARPHSLHCAHVQYTAAALRLRTVMNWTARPLLRATFISPAALFARM